MLHIIITSYNEPKATLRAIQTFLKQGSNLEIKITVVDPFPEVENFINENIKDRRVNFFLDPGEGKSYALNILFQENFSTDKDDLFVLTDGDVYVHENTLNEIVLAFKDAETGCVTGKPVAIDSRRNKYGYWSHFAFAGIDKARTNLSRAGKFMECSGYLFAIRNGVLTEFPLEASEDAIIPYLFWKKGYKTKYLPNAEVYVKNPENLQDYLNQKVRNIKGHENLNKLAPDLPRTKSLPNEIKHGWYFLFTFPKTVKELFWTIQLYFLRLYIWLKGFYEIRFNKKYADGWRKTEINSTKPLD